MSFARIALGAALACCHFACTGAAGAAEPKALSCTFASGRAHTFERGRFKPTKASPLKMEIADIDADRQTAALKGGSAVPVLRVVRAVNALHFIEIVGEGYMNITTVYDAEAAGKPMPAVHSRHFGVLGQPVVSHYVGTCSGS